MVSCLAISKDGRWILSGSKDCTMNIWDVTDGRCCQTFTGHEGNVKSVAFSPDEDQIISGSRDHSI